MQKKGLLFAGALLLFAACSNEGSLEVQTPVSVDSAEVCINVKDFTVTHEPFPGTRAVEDVAKYENVGAITLAFYDADDKEVFRSTQIKADASTYTKFGQFSCKLPVGDYTLVSIGRELKDGDEFVFTSQVKAEYTSERVRETFTSSQSVSIPEAVHQEIDVTLQRIVTMVQVFSTDVRPAEVAKIRTTYGAASKSFNPSTGLATDSNGFSVTNSPNNPAGITIGVGSYAFLPANEQTMDITVEALDADGNALFTKVIPDVTLCRNQITMISGKLFTPTTSDFTIKINADWLPEQVIYF